MKRSTVSVLVVAVVVTMLMPTALAERNGVSSTFTNNTQGWTVTVDAVDTFGGASNNWDLVPEFTATGGNPGGAIYAVDAGKGLTFFFQAPRKYTGNKRGYFGGALEFDVKFSGSGVVFGRNVPDVVLVGGGLTLVADAGPEPTMEWSHYSVRLNESAGWRIANLATGAVASRSQILRVLKHLTVVQIRGEYTNGIDTGYLDNVRLLRDTDSCNEEPTTGCE